MREDEENGTAPPCFSWKSVADKEVRRIDASPRAEPVLVTNMETKGSDFFVRMSNSSRALTTQEAPRYISVRARPSRTR